MTERQNLERHQHSLTEIREIMNSMKTLAYMESRKLARFLDAQQTVVRNMEEVARDFLSFFPATLPEVKANTSVYLVIGTERGFCGDFNHALLRYLDSKLLTTPPANSILVIIGHKLHMLCEKDMQVSAFIEGANVTDETTVVLNQVVDELASLQNQYGSLNLYALYHSDELNVVVQKLLPPFQHCLQQPVRFTQPPILNLPPTNVIIDLIDQYLFAALHEILFTSLMAENKQRVMHLEKATRNLDDKTAKLGRRRNALRQEEIIEEIEVILLSAASLSP